MSFDLRTARLNEGLSQRELSRKTGCPVETIRRLETGLGARPAHAKLLADHFEVQVTDLLPDSERSAA